MDNHVTIAPNYVQQTIRWLVKRYHPLAEVESEEYRSMVQAIHPSVEIMTVYRVRMEIMKFVADIKIRFRRLFEGASHSKVVLTTDAWTGTDNQAYICLTLHFITKEWTLQSFCSGVLNCGVEGHGAMKYAAALVTLLRESGIERSMVEVMVTDTENTMQKLGRVFENEWQFHGCIAHTIDLVAKMISTSDATASYMETIRKFIAAFRKSPCAVAGLKARMTATG